VYHGFVRAVDGTIATFDVPGGVGGCEAFGINDAGAITGVANEKNGAYRGFVRSPGGKFEIFSASDTGHGSNQGTLGYAINDSSTITGSYETNTATGSFGYVRTH